MKEEATSLVVVVLVVSFLGFVLENIWLAFTKGYMDNRKMTLPFLLGYGLFVVGMYVFFGTPRKMCILGGPVLKGRTEFLYFIVSAVTVSIGEIILGTVVERFMGFEYWNYEWIPLHITKYTSVPTSIGFGAAVTFVMDSIFPVVRDLSEKFYSSALSYISVLLLLLCIADMLFSFAKMNRNQGINLKWRVDMPESTGVYSILVHPHQ